MKKGKIKIDRAIYLGDYNGRIYRYMKGNPECLPAGRQGKD